MMVTLSWLAFETKTFLPPATTPPGLLPPMDSSPTEIPVLIFAVTRGCAGSETSTTHTEFDSGTFGSPRPGIRFPSITVPCSASFDGKPNAGKSRPVFFESLGATT
ncbi:MAG: hypothetical protein DMG26_04325 [Acidobacteria bacterium]|nr:MAG: hypothetical protein DMG26_04325 [Acidobacteriota bacterium]